MTTYWLEGGKKNNALFIRNQSSYQELEQDVPIHNEIFSSQERIEYSNYNDINYKKHASQSIANIE